MNFFGPFSPKYYARKHTQCSHWNINSGVFFQHLSISIDVERVPMFLFSCARTNSCDSFVKNSLAPTSHALGSYEPFSRIHSIRDEQPVVVSWAQPAREEASNGEEVPIPEHSVGMYHLFCHPDLWSPVFAASGEFTVKVVRAFFKNGVAMFQFAIICSSVRSLIEETRANAASKRCAYVKCTTRTEQQVSEFFNLISLRYVGHRFAENLPGRRGWTELFTGGYCLDAQSKAIQSLLCTLLSMTRIGFNHLVVLDDPIIEDMHVRKFLDLLAGFGDSTIIATCSCDARIERKEERPLLPSAWFDSRIETSAQAVGNSTVQDLFMSPRQVAARTWQGIQPQVKKSLCIKPHIPDGNLQRSFKPNTCIRFISPSQWHSNCCIEDAFTVDITSITMAQDVAYFGIVVLYYAHNRLEQTCVRRRYSDFVRLADQMDRKLSTILLSQLLPRKTFRRPSGAKSIERRAYALQLFLEYMLNIQFRGVLDQKVPLSAEPNVRSFLNLPQVRWNLVPHALATEPAAELQRYRQKSKSFVRSKAYNEPIEVFPSDLDTINSPLSSSDCDASNYCSLGQQGSDSE